MEVKSRRVSSGAATPAEDARRERRRGRRESDIALLAHLGEILAEDPEAVMLHTPAVVERMEPSAWAWAPPGGEIEGRFAAFDASGARGARGGPFAPAEAPWLRPAEGLVHRVLWPDGEVFVFSRSPEVEGAERWEGYIVQILASFLRNARREMVAHKRPKFSFYAEAEAETLAMLAGEAERTRRLDLPLSAMFVRLDGVKGLNETRGLAAGDAAFTQLGLLLYRYAGESVRIGRAGTDGFLVVFPSQTRRETERWWDATKPRVEAELREAMNEAGLAISARVGEIPADADNTAALARYLGIGVG